MGLVTSYIGNQRALRGLPSIRLAGYDRGLDTDTLAYVDAVNKNGGSITSASISAIDSFVKGLKLDGLWDLFDMLWPCAGDNLSAALVCLKAQPGTSAVLTNVGPFVASDYSPTGGLTGDGSTKRLVSNVNLSVTQALSAHISVYVLAAKFDNKISVGNFSLAYLHGIDGGVMGSGTLNNTITWPGRRVGLISLSLLSGTLSEYKASALLNSIASSFTSLPTSMGILGGPSAVLYSSNTVSFASCGAGMNATQVAAFSNRVEALNVALNRRMEPIVNAHPDWVVTIGQSLALGSLATPTSVTAVGSNLMLDDPNQDMTSVSVGAAKLAPLITVAAVEPPVLGFANSFSTVASGRVVFSTGSARSGTSYSLMSQGTSAYLQNLNLAIAAWKMFQGKNQIPVIRCLLCTHGEADDQGTANASYGANLATWQSNYETDLKSITGQSSAIPMIYSQYHSWATIVPRTTPYTTLQQLAAYIANPTKCLLACPKYFLPYVDSYAHLTGAGYQWLGEYYAKVLYTTLILSQSWVPLYPLTVTRVGNTITAVMSKGGLVADTTLVSDPSGTYASRTFTQGYTAATNSTVTNFQGFEFMDDTVTAPSASVVSYTITTTNIANDTVVLVLSGAPTGANKRLRYAYTMTLSNAPGPTTGPRGNLRDSDTSYASQYGKTLYNWCLTFDMDAS